MQAPLTHILPLTQIRRVRALPVSGRVLAKVHQSVTATDVMAETTRSGSHIIIDVRRSLGMARIDQAEQLIQRRVGEKLQKGDVIAEGGGLLPRTVRTPIDGEVVMISAGRVFIEVPGAPVTVQAGMAGEVIEIIPERGVVIETTGALLQGVWGNNRINQGMLLNLLHSPDDEITLNRLDVSMRGAIVLAGFCADPAVLQSANDLPLRGLILSSMSAELISVASKVEYPLVVMEGFGRLPMNSSTFKILTTNEKRDVAVNAMAWNPYTGERPEVVIALDAPTTSTLEADEFKVGQTVRVISPPYASRLGILTAIRPNSQILPNGLRALVADIRLETGDQVIVPLANLDVLE